MAQDLYTRCNFSHSHYHFFCQCSVVMLLIDLLSLKMGFFCIWIIGGRDYLQVCKEGFDSISDWCYS